LHPASKRVTNLFNQSLLKKKIMKTKNLFFIGAILLSAATGSCKKDDNKSPQTLYGPAVAVGADSIRSFVVLNENGQA
jgi:hypothetical protein